MISPVLLLALSFIPQQLPEPPKESTPARITRAAIILGVGLADGITTRQALGNGSGHEANPVMVGIAGSTPKMMATKLAIHGLLAWQLDKLGKTRPKTAWVIASAVSAVFTTVAARNYRIAAGSVR